MRLLPLALIFVGCEQRKPAWDDDSIERLRREEPGIKEECVEELRWKGLPTDDRPVDKCFEMSPQQRFEGEWIAQFEGSQFCPAGETCTEDSKNEIWLSFADEKMFSGEYDGTIYDIDFIGRRTRVAGNHGHFGMLDHEVIVDRIISLKKIGRVSSEPG